MTLWGLQGTCPRLSASCATFLGKLKQIYCMLALPPTDDPKILD